MMIHSPKHTTPITKSHSKTPSREAGGNLRLEIQDVEIADRLAAVVELPDVDGHHLRNLPAGLLPSPTMRIGTITVLPSSDTHGVCGSKTSNFRNSSSCWKKSPTWASPCQLK